MNLVPLHFVCGKNINFVLKLAKSKNNDGSGNTKVRSFFKDSGSF
jgi:hypothetical protein